MNRHIVVGMLLLAVVSVFVSGCLLFGPKIEINPVASVSGIVTDTSGNPVANALVSLNGLIATTDSQGAFSYSDVPLGPVTITVTVDGKIVFDRTYQVDQRTVHLSIEITLWTFFDDASNLANQFTRSAANKNEVFIIDGNEEVAGHRTPYGTFRLYAEEPSASSGLGARFANAYFDILPTANWTVEFRAKFASLATYDESLGLALAPYRGFVVGVRADWGRIYLISFYKGAIAILNSPDTLYAVDPSIVGDPESEFHTWRISYDVAAQTLTISKDGVQVLSQSEVQNGGHGEQTGLRLATSNEGILGVSDVYLDYIAFKQ